MPLIRRRVGPFSLWLLALVVALGSAASLAAQSGVLFSPARGHAEVIAQGVSALPTGDLIWRASYREAKPGAPARFAAAGPGWVVAADGAMVVQDGDGRRSLLAPGEAAFLPASGAATITAVGEDPAHWFAVDLAPKANAGAGEASDQAPVFRSPAFASPGGQRDFDLVRDVLKPDETTTIIGGTTPVLVVATAGSMQVRASDGSTAPLALGDASVFSGDILVRGAGDQPAAFFAAVIGEPVGAATPAATPLSTPVSSPLASPPASPIAIASAANGVTLSVDVYACPAGTTAETASKETCAAKADAVDLALIAVNGLGALDLGPPIVRDSATLPYWPDLEPGGYILQARKFGSGLARFVVPRQGSFAASAPDGYEARSDEGYPVALDGRAAAVQLAVFAIPAPDGAAMSSDDLVRSTAVAVARRGSIGVRVWSCPASSIAALDPTACATATPPFDLALSGGSNAAPLTLANLQPNGESVYVWRDLPFGEYELRQPELPAGAASYYVPGSAAVALLADGTGYGIAIDQSAPAIVVDVYDLAAPVEPTPAPPMPVPPTPVPPAVTATAPAPVPAAASTAPPATAADEEQPAPTSAPTNQVDSDGDSLTDDFEINVTGTDPNRWDTDGDGISDGQEYLNGTNPLVPNGAAPTAAPAAPTAQPAADSDGDGLTDDQETTIGTDPTKWDTDGDGWSDGVESRDGTNPLDAASHPVG
jgi:thrombospondin type 3 repeat protein